MMSEACRLTLKWADGVDGAGGSVPNSVFYKRIVMGDLEHVQLKARTAPLKIARDVKSYAVVSTG